jgi:hypothetical protein
MKNVDQKHGGYKQRSARANILEFYPARPEDHLARSSPSPKFTFKYVTRTRPKPDFLLFQPEWSPIYLQSALTIVSLIQVSLMKAVRTTETSVNIYQTTRRYNSEDSHLRTHRRENLKSYQFQCINVSNPSMNSLTTL